MAALERSYPATNHLFFELINPVSLATLQQINHYECPICKECLILKEEAHIDTTRDREITYDEINDHAVYIWISEAGLSEYSLPKPTDTLCLGPVALSCGHIFDFACLDIWLRNQDEYELSCPVCRTKPAIVNHITGDHESAMKDINEMLQRYETKYTNANRWSRLQHTNEGALHPPDYVFLTPGHLERCARWVNGLICDRAALTPFAAQRPKLYHEFVRMFYEIWADEACRNFGWCDDLPAPTVEVQRLTSYFTSRAANHCASPEVRAVKGIGREERREGICHFAYFLRLTIGRAL